MSRLIGGNSMSALLLSASVALAGCSSGEVPARAVTIDEDKFHVVALPAKLGDWPVWRGPRGDGISDETDFQTTWPKEGPKKLWEANLGNGYCAVSVVGDRLYTMGRSGDKDDVVYCLNPETGKEIWRHTYPCALVNNLHDGGPGATPAIFEGRVYTFSRDGEVFCLNADTGKVLWSKQLAKDLGVARPEWGFTSSPVILDDKLLLDAGHAVALDRKTGEIVWKSERKCKPGYGAVAPFDSPKGKLLAVLNNGFLLILDAAKGTEIASEPFVSSYDTTAVTPIVRGNTIFISAGYDLGCKLLELKDGKLELVYANKKMRNHFSTCVLIGSELYGIDGNTHSRRLGKLVCMDYATGEVKWSKSGLGVGSLMAANGTLIVLGDEGDLVLAEAKPDEYKELAKAKVLDGTCWTMPVLVGGKIYCRNSTGKFVCLDVRR